MDTIQKESPKIPASCLENYQQIRFLVEDEEKNTKLVEKLAGKRCEIFSVPEWKEDIHDIHGLYELSKNF